MVAAYEPNVRNTPPMITARKSASGMWRRARVASSPVVVTASNPTKESTPNTIAPPSAPKPDGGLNGTIEFPAAPPFATTTMHSAVTMTSSTARMTRPKRTEGRTPTMLITVTSASRIRAITTQFRLTP